MAVINITGADSGGVIAAGMPFEVELVTGQTRGGSHAGGQIVKIHKGNLSNAGLGSFTVVRNDQITPPGSKYKVTLGEGIWWIQVNGTGPYDLGDPAIETDDTVPAVPAPAGPPGTVEAAGSVSFTNLVSTPATPDAGARLYSRALPDGSDELVYVTRTGRVESLPREMFVDLAKHGAHPDEDPSTNSGAIQSALDQCASTGRILFVPDGTYNHDDTLAWSQDGTSRALEVWMSRDSEFLYTGTGWGWDLDMDSGAADLPPPTFIGGRISRTTDAAGGMWGNDVRNGLFRMVTFDCVDGDAGIGLRLDNEGRWTERTRIEQCRFVDNSTGVWVGLYRVTPTTKQKAGGVARVSYTSATGDRWNIGDRTDIELDPPDADYDGDRQITNMGAGWIEFATTAGTTAPTPTAGTLASRGSLARLTVEDIFLQGGVGGQAHLHFEEGTGPYGGEIRGVRGNIEDDTAVLYMRPGAWAGTKVGDFDVELAGAGTACYLVDAPDDWTGGRCEWVGEARTTAAVLFYRTDPTGQRPWHPLTMRGGIQTEADGFADFRTGGIAIPARSGADPSDANYYDSDPPIGTVEVRHDTDELWALMGGGSGDWRKVRLDTTGPLSTRVARLTADATRTSTTSVAAESELDLVDVVANSTWILDGLLIVSGTVGLDVALDVPGGSPAAEITWGDDLVATLTTQSGNTPVERAIAAAGTPAFVRIHGTFSFGSIAGTLAFLWAQTTTDAAPTTIHKGSWLRAQRLT